MGFQVSKNCLKRPLKKKIKIGPVGRQMAIENYISNDFLSTFFDSINVFNRRLPGVLTVSNEEQALK